MDSTWCALTERPFSSFTHPSAPFSARRLAEPALPFSQFSDHPVIVFSATMWHCQAWAISPSLFKVLITGCVIPHMDAVSRPSEPNVSFNRRTRQLPGSCRVHKFLKRHVVTTNFNVHCVGLVLDCYFPRSGRIIRLVALPPSLSFLAYCAERRVTSARNQRRPLGGA